MPFGQLLIPSAFQYFGNFLLKPCIKEFTLQFECRCQHAGIDGPFFRQETELLDLFPFSEVGIQSLDFLMYQCHDFRLLYQFSVGGFTDTMLGTPGIELYEGRHNQCTDVFVLITSDNHDLFDKSAFLHFVFDRLRSDVFTAGSLEKLFFPVSYLEKMIAEMLFHSPMSPV